MSYQDTRYLRASLRPYTRRNNLHAIAILAGDMLLYISAIAGLLYFENTLIKLVLGILAGMLVSSIFVIAHDAAHDSFTTSKKLNKVIARVTYMLSLHNYSLWLTAHNRVHHQVTNIKDMNSWSPLSKDEYDKRSVAGKWLQRVYRTPPGMCLYYMIERWWKYKFYPFESIAGRYNAVYLDFMLLVAYLTGYVAFLVTAGYQLQTVNPLEALGFGLMVPFLTWNFMMGFTVYQHHTHESIAWTRTREESRAMGGQADFTMYVRFPRWYNLISHNIMEHTAHHVDPRIPCYNLEAAQQHLAGIMGDDMHRVDFSITGFLTTLSRCKLYDYDNHCWMDFNGVPTTEAVVMEDSSDLQNYVKAA